MRFESYRRWVLLVVILLLEAAAGSPSLAQGVDVHAGSRPLSESTAMLMFGVSLVLIGVTLHRRNKASSNRVVYRPSRQLSVRLNDR
jgi:hypothetical protein